MPRSRSARFQLISTRSGLIAVPFLVKSGYRDQKEQAGCLFELRRWSSLPLHIYLTPIVADPSIPTRSCFLPTLLATNRAHFRGPRSAGSTLPPHGSWTNLDLVKSITA